MAKNYGIFGRTSGKVGNVVFTNTSDGQIASAYNPNKPKERSQAQIDSSAKFAFMKKVSALFPPELLLGLGGNDKENRRKFDSMILRNVVWEGEGVERHPTLDALRIVFAEGELKLPWNSIMTNEVQYGVRSGLPVVQNIFRPAIGRQNVILGEIMLGLSSNPERKQIMRTGVVAVDEPSFFPNFYFSFGVEDHVRYGDYTWFRWIIVFEYNAQLVEDYELKKDTFNLNDYNLNLWKKLFALKRSDSIIYWSKSIN